MTKPQIPDKFQVTGSKSEPNFILAGHAFLRINYWNLDIVWDLGLGR
jgi:hypothetical protein